MNPVPIQSSADGAELKAEGSYLYRCFFKGEPPSETLDRYVDANVICAPAPSALMRALVLRGLDAEAVEFALRSRRGRTVLTTKIQILFYLLEVRSDCYPYFVGDGETWLRASLGLLGSVFRTALKFLKGAYLVRRHGLC